MTDQLFSVGMTSDQCVKVFSEHKLKPLLNPKVTGQNQYGMRVQWYLRDNTLTFERVDEHGPYLLKWIGPPVKVRPLTKREVKGEKKTKRGRRGKNGQNGGIEDV